MNRRQRRGQAKLRPSLDYEKLYAALADHHAAMQPGRARSIYRRILEDDNPAALGLFGDAALRHREFDRAAALIARSIELGPASSSLYSELGLALRGAGKLEAAQSVLETATTLDDENFRAWTNRGIVHADRGQLDEAIAAFEKAVARNPNHADARLQLGEAQLRTKRAAEALESIEAALMSQPGSTWGLALQSAALCELGETRVLAELMSYEALIVQIDAGPPEGFDDLERFNRSLARHILRHPTLRREPDGYSTRGGSQTLGNLLRDSAPVVRALESLIAATLEPVLAVSPTSSGHPQILRRPRELRMEGWGVKLSTGGHQESHIHRDGWLSGVYYVDLGGVVSSAEPHEGWLEIGRAPAALHPTGSVPETRRVRPQAGRFVLFPSYHWHQTIPFQTRGERVSFAFDLIPA